MKISTKDCILYIIEWYKQNPTILPFHFFVKSLEERGGLGDGTKLGNWKRRAKVSIGTKTYRAFRPESSVIDNDVVVVIIEENNSIVKLEYGKTADFSGQGKYFKEIGFW